MDKPVVPFADLVAELTSPASSIRLEAIKQIMRRKSERGQAYTYLAPLSNDPDYQVRKAALQALGNLGDPQALQVLISALSDRLANIRVQAIKALEKLGNPQAFASLVSVLGDTFVGVRIAALHALVWLDAQQAFPYLQAALGDTSTKVRCVVLSILVDHYRRQAELYLVAAQKDESGEVRWRALIDLVKIAMPQVSVPHLLRGLADDFDDRRVFAVNTLGRLGTTNAQVVPGLLALATHPDAKVRVGVFEALRELSDPQSLFCLLHALRDEEPLVRANVVNTLKKLGDQRAVEPMLALLVDENEYVRRRVADTLSSLKDPRAIEPLLSVLSSDREAEVRRHAFWALGRITKRDQAFHDLWQKASATERNLLDRKIIDAVTALVVDH